jgi:hypothetical protein
MRNIFTTALLACCLFASVSYAQNDGVAGSAISNPTEMGGSSGVLATGFATTDIKFLVGTIAADDTSPSVTGYNIFVTSANTVATAITTLDNEEVGQIIWLCGGSNADSSTIATAGQFSHLPNNATWTASTDHCLEIFVQGLNDFVVTASNEPTTSTWVGTATSDLDMDTYNILFTPGSGPADVTLDERGLTSGVRTTDSTGQNMHINAGDLSPFATQSTTTPGNLILRGGLDAKRIYVLDGLAGCTAADWVGITRIIDGTVTGPTTLTYGTNWGTGGGLTATIAATQLAAAIDALSGVGATASGAKCPGLGAAGDRCVGVTADRFTSLVILYQNDATCSVLSQYASDYYGDSKVLIATNYVGGQCAQQPDLAAEFSPGSGLSWWLGYPNSIGIVAGGSTRLFWDGTAWGDCTSNYFTVYTVQIRDGSFLQFGSTTKTKLDGDNADGKLSILKAAGTGAGLDATSAGVLGITDAAGTGTGNLAYTPGVADVAARPGVVHMAENASHLATTAGSKTGANACVCAGVGQRLYTISDYTNVTSVTIQTTHDCELQSAAAYTCAGMGTCLTSNAVTAKAFVTAINAALPVGIEAAACTVAGGANCSDGLFVVKSLPDTCLTVLTQAGSGVASTSSADGSVRIPTSITGDAGGPLATGGITNTGAITTTTYMTAWSYLGAGTYVYSTDLALTDATATASNKGYLRTATAKYLVDTTHIIASAGAGDDTTSLKMVTLPLKTEVVDAMFVVNIAETHLTNMTVSCGRTGAAYIDYIVAGSAQTQQILGNAAGERGANLTGYDVPAYAWGDAVTDVYCQFVTTDAGHDLNDVVAFSGWLAITTRLLP